MNAGRDVERLIATWLAEEAPGRAPDWILANAAGTIDRTRQRRFRAAWRAPMSIGLRGLAAMAVVVIAIALGAVLVATRPLSPPVGATASPPATTIPPASAGGAVRPLANGTYRASIAVADINARLQADTNLTPNNRATIINSILLIPGATTLDVEISIDEDKFTLAYGTDGVARVAGPAWRLYVLDATTIALGDPTGSSGIQAWGVQHGASGFTMRAMSPASDDVETFVRSVLFESKPFSPKI